jgi:hypothetical protein
MLCVTKSYALPNVDVIILDSSFKSATLELIEVLPAKEKTLLADFWQSFYFVPCPLEKSHTKTIVKFHSNRTLDFPADLTNFLC